MGKTKEVAGIIKSLVSVATAEVKKNGIFTIPGLCRIKTRVKPATKAGKKMIFGKEVGESKASQDSCESFPSGCIEKPDLRDTLAFLVLWESYGTTASTCLLSQSHFTSQGEDVHPLFSVKK